MKLSRNFIIVLSIILFTTLFMIITEVKVSNNQPKVKSLLTSSLQIGATELSVKDLTAMKSFYHNVVGLEVLQTDGNKLVLGHDKRPIITLIEETELPVAAKNQAGLYHNAIVYKSRGQLARTVKTILEKTPQYFSGTADHLVSEAFYFVDPEGNGLELYFDKDPQTWVWNNGRITMGSEYINPETYIQQYVSEQSSSEKHMGHIHLKVGDIAMAKNFYVDILGFDITSERPDALFISVNGYHHHVGMNTWESAGASKRDNTLGLKSVTFKLSSRDEIDALSKRLTDNNITFKEGEIGLTVLDPWNNKILIRD